MLLDQVFLSRKGLVLIDVGGERIELIAADVLDLADYIERNRAALEEMRKQRRQEIVEQMARMSRDVA